MELRPSWTQGGGYRTFCKKKDEVATNKHRVDGVAEAGRRPDLQSYHERFVKEVCKYGGDITFVNYDEPQMIKVNNHDQSCKREVVHSVGCLIHHECNSDCYSVIGSDDAFWESESEEIYFLPDKYT